MENFTSVVKGVPPQIVVLVCCCILIPVTLLPRGLRVSTRRDGGRTFVYQSPIANATHYPDSGEGPNEHALTYLPASSGHLGKA